MFTLKFAADTPPLKSHGVVWSLITNTSAQYFLSNWKVFFFSSYLSIISNNFHVYSNFYLNNLCWKYFLYVEDKERVKKKKVKEHKRSSKLKDNSYSNLPIGCSSSNIYFQPLNLVSVFQFLLKSNFSWSTFCLSSQHNLPSKLNIWLKLNFCVKIF